MAQVQPIGKVWLLKDIPWSKNYQHTAYFADATSQHSWICGSSHIIGSANPKEGQNYIKSPLQGTIKISGHSYTYRNCNYICWQNTNIEQSLDGTPQREDKYYYAFVDEIRFTSNTVFEVDYTVDVLQTFLFAGGGCTLNKCYIERTHTQTDTVGAHIEPEPITSDRYVFTNGSVTHFYGGDVSGWSVLMYATKARSEGTAIKSMGVRCGLPQGVYCNVFEADGEHDAFYNFAQWLNGLTDGENGSYAEWINKIVAVVAVPSEFISESAGGLANTDDWFDDVTITKYTTSLDDYTPTNKKLLTYPYNCHFISDGDGSSMEYAYEFFPDTMTFKMALAVQPQPEFIVAPYGYKGFPDNRPNYDYKCAIKNYPMIPFVGDAYKQYIGSQGLSNAVNLLMNSVGGAITGGILTGNVGGALLGATTALAKTDISQELAGRQAKMSADGAHISSNSAMLALGQKTFYDCQKCVCKKDAKKIDNFFSTYGYAIQTIGTVHYTNDRFNQHYVKTRNCCCVGGAPSKVIEQIEDIFNAGITIWKDGDKVGTYSGLQ